MNAYSQVLHLDAPAERTVDGIDKFVSSQNEHQPYEWWGYRLKYRLKRKDDKRTESQKTAEGDQTVDSDQTAGGEDMTVPDLVSLYTPGENDLISRGVDKFLYHFFLVRFAFRFRSCLLVCLSP